MIAIRRSTSPSQESQCTPNVLPCRVHHTGAVDASKRHWNPKPSEGGKKRVFKEKQQNLETGFQPYQRELSK